MQPWVWARVTDDPLAGVPTLADVDLAGKRVLVREDFNVPIAGGKVASSTRIDAALPTIEHCRGIPGSGTGSAVLLVSHLGRPKPGERDPALSLAPVAEELSRKLGAGVRLITDWRGGVRLNPGEVALLENIRFEPGELADDEALGRALAALCDVFVMDAFGTAHRAHASTCAVARFARAACAGPLLARELEALGRALAEPARPLVAIVGGSKVSTKLGVLERLAGKADSLLIGGGMVNTFLAAQGVDVGASAVENAFDAARRIMAAADVPMPVDVMTAPAMDSASPARLRPLGEIGGNELVLDIGPETARRFGAIVKSAGTILWNGPLGVFEFDQFGEGTRVVAEAVAASRAFSVAGGGDTLAAIDKYGVREGVSYLSTGGGAFLEFVEGRKLPGVEALRRAGN